MFSKFCLAIALCWSASAAAVNFAPQPHFRFEDPIGPELCFSHPAGTEGRAEWEMGFAMNAPPITRYPFPPALEMNGTVTWRASPGLHIGNVIFACPLNDVWTPLQGCRRSATKEGDSTVSCHIEGANITECSAMAFYTPATSGDYEISMHYDDVSDDNPGDNEWQFAIRGLAPGETSPCPMYP